MTVGACPYCERDEAVRELALLKPAVAAFISRSNCYGEDYWAERDRVRELLGYTHGCPTCGRYYLTGEEADTCTHPGYRLPCQCLTCRNAGVTEWAPMGACYHDLTPPEREAWHERKEAGVPPQGEWKP